jgi:hypothetical protein
MFLVTRLWRMVQFRATNLSKNMKLNSALLGFFGLYPTSGILKNITFLNLHLFPSSEERGGGQLVVALMGEKKNAHRILVGRPEGKRSLAKPRRRWRDL